MRVDLGYMVKANKGRNAHLKGKGKSTGASASARQPQSAPKRRSIGIGRKRGKAQKQYVPPEMQMEQMEQIDQDQSLDVLPDELEFDVEEMLEEVTEEVTDGGSVGEVGDEEVDVVEKEATVNEEVVAVSSPIQPERRFYRPASPIQRRLTRVSTDAVENDTSLPGSVTLMIPAPVRAEYAARKNPQQPLREYLVERLAKCQDHTASKPIYIDDEVRQELERLSGRNMDTAEDLLGWCMYISTLRLGALKLNVDTDLIARALFRKDADQTDGECLSEYLSAGIEIKTGMR